MRKISLLALLLGASAIAMAAVVEPARPRTPVDVVDISAKEIPVDVPVEVEEELVVEDLGHLREYQGLEDAKYMRNIVTKLRDDPEAIMRNVYGASINDIDMEHYADKKALGTNREVYGVNLKHETKDGHWADSLSDVRLPDFPGDYNDMAEMKEEMRAERNKGVEQLMKTDFDKLQQTAPIMQVR